MPRISVEFRTGNDPNTLLEHWEETDATPVPRKGDRVNLGRFYFVTDVLWTNHGDFYEVRVTVTKGSDE